MPVVVHNTTLPLSVSEIDKLWQLTRKARQCSDAEVSVTTTDEKGISELNKTYRHKDKVTNVLTFSYPALEVDGKEISPVSHDVVICEAVARREAGERGSTDRDYVALLLVHAFLHATGLDHEISSKKAAVMQEMEAHILSQAGYLQATL